MSTQPARGLPPRIYLPIVALTAVLFLGVLGYFLKISFGVSGSALGPVTAPQSDTGASSPPADVARMLDTLQARLRKNPHDGAALVLLAKTRADYARALFNEGMRAQSNGSRSEAVAAYTKFLKIAPHDSRAPEARDALRLLQS